MAKSESTLDRMRREAHDIFQAALRAVDPEEAILRHVKFQDDTLSIGERQFKLTDYDRVFVVGAGKADAPMAKALESLLRDRIEDGVIVVKEGHGLSLRKVQVREAGHPVPSYA
jgi:hydroxypyruvate reductase